MNEQKVWVGEMPEGCWDCPCFDMYESQCQINYADCVELDIAKERHKNCPLQLIKDHDRELVRQVCAKISRFIDKMKGVKFDERRIFVELENLKIEIQKEFEK